MVITELQTYGEVLLREAAGPRVRFQIATEIEKEIQWGASDGFGLLAESTPHPGNSDCNFRSPIDMRTSRVHPRT